MPEQIVVLGDCLQVMRGMGDATVDLVLTDPPYGMGYQSSWRTDKYDPIKNDVDMSWIPEFAQQIYRLLKEDTHAYIFCNDYAISSFRDELERVGFKVKRTLVWVKNNHTSGDLEGDYGNKTEFILYAHKGRRPLNGHRDTNVLEFNRVNTDLHPTQKPQDLCEYLITKSTQVGETVLDPFCGSGTTLCAAMATGRNAVGIELDERYANVAERRLSNTTPPMFISPNPTDA